MKRKCIVLLIGSLVICANAVLAGVVGEYEIADFSSYDRAISLGSAVTESSVVQHNGMDFVTLSGDNGYIKTDGDLAGFTYNSDWSWMTILKKDSAVNCRIFMRGAAWVDKGGDFDLRMHEDRMYSWHRQGGWNDLMGQDADINSQALWLASTYDVSENINILYVNGKEVARRSIAPMDDRGNTNPLNINGQWAGNAHGVGNIYVEGTFDLGQFILSQSCYSQQILEQVYQNGSYMPSDNNTWLDVKVVPEPATLLLFGLAGLVLRKKRKTL